MAEKKRITVFLGAGSSLEAGFPSTEDLTRAFIKQIDLAGLICDAFSSGYSRKLNFEEIFHLIRIMDGMAESSLPSDSILKPRANDCIHVIKERIINACEGFKEGQNKTPSWYSGFWQELGSDFFLDIISLNYDNLFENMIFSSKELETGFQLGEGSQPYEEFHPERLLNNYHNKHRLLRLHGCVNFCSSSNINIEQIDQHASTYYYQTGNLFWQRNAKTQKNQATPYGRSERKDEIINIYANNRKSPASSIITGWDKENFFRIDPYKSYMDLLPQFFKNKLLLTIGFGRNTNDSHLLEHINQYCGPQIEITKQDPEEKRPNALSDHKNRYRYNSGFKAVDAAELIARINALI